MAQSGYTPILIYASGTATNVPLAANMTSSASGAELALNYADGKLYYKNSSGVVTLLASATTVTNSFSAGTTGFTPSTATTGAVTLAGTLITSNGGTGLSSYTAGDLSYYASGTALTKLAIGTAGQILTSSGTAPQWSTLSGVAVTTFSAGTTGLTPSSATSGAVTLAGTLNVANGGTGLTSLTAGYIPFGAGTSAFGNSANLFWDNTNARFGVGTASPISIVNASFSGGTVSGTHSMAFGYPYAANLQLKSTNAGTSVAVASVGLYSNPERTKEFAFYNQATDARVGYLGYQYGAGGAITDLGVFNALAGALTFSTNNTEVGRFTSAGYLGVGTSSPLSPLDVNGSIATPSFSAGAIANLANTNTASTADTRLVFRTTQTPDGLRERAIIVGSLESTSGGYLSFWTRPNGDGISEKVRITAAGNVGIGTTSPKLKLEVVGTDAAESGTATPNGAIIVGNPTASNSQNLTMGTLNGAGNHSWIQSRNSTQAAFYSLALNPSGGNVGIGTTAPASKLEINGNGELLRLDGSNGQDRSIYLRNVGSANIGKIFTDGTLALETNAATSITFTTNSTEKMRISSSALAIGTTSVAAATRLNVVGGSNMTYWEGGNNSTNITSGTPDQALCKFSDNTIGNFWQTRFLNNAGNTMFSMGAQTTSHTANFNNGKFFVDGGVRATPETFIVDTTNEYSYFGYSGSNGAYRIQVNGQIFATSATIATSDGRYKENVQDLTDALELVKALRPVSFNWKKHNIHVFNTEDTTVGFIAQEVQQAMADKPYLNSFIKLNKCTSFDQVEQKYSDEEFLGLAETNMVAILTKALQELNAKFDAYVASHP